MTWLMIFSVTGAVLRSGRLTGQVDVFEEDPDNVEDYGSLWVDKLVLALLSSRQETMGSSRPLMRNLYPKAYSLERATVPEPGGREKGQRPQAVSDSSSGRSAQSLSAESVSPGATKLDQVSGALWTQGVVVR